MGITFVLVMLEWKSNQSEVVIGFSARMWFFFILQDIPYIRLQIADKWYFISCILERENKEFQEAMRAQVGTTFSHANNSSRMISQNILGAVIITQCTARKEPKFQTMFLSVVNFCRD